MRTISTALQTHLDGELTTLAQCVKITRQDGVTIAFTTHDADLAINGVTYLADGAYAAGKMEDEATLKENDYAITGILDSDLLDEADILAGLYDHAAVDVYVVNWADLSQGALQIRSGWLGQVALSQGKYVAALRGKRDLLERRVGDVYTPECRHDLGASLCGVDLTALTVTGTVTSMTDAAVFCDATRTEADDWFSYGVMTWTGGLNAGQSMEIRDWALSSKTFTLWLPMPYAIAVGDSYTAYPGCDKRFSTCKSKFSNVSNFGGFPHLPGLDKILQYPDAR